MVGAVCQFRGVYAASILFSFTGVVLHVLARAQLFTQLAFHTIGFVNWLFTQLALSTFYERKYKIVSHTP